MMSSAATTGWNHANPPPRPRLPAVRGPVIAGVPVGGVRGVSLELTPIEFAEACAFVALHHRHHAPPQGHKFSIAASEGDQVRGVVMVGRPVARGRQDGWTLEVTRLCTDGTRNACSMLYAAAWRATRALGYRRLGTYTLASESGASLRAAGWRIVGEVHGRSWSCQSRPRVDTHPTQDKLLWEPV